MRRIDLKTILQHTVSSLYGDLVTRPTGQKVRNGVERELASLDGEQVVVIDFGTVRCLDISCADEIVGRILLDHGHARTIVLQGVDTSHCDAIEQVLERHQIAVVARDRTGRIRVLGPVQETARRAFGELTRRGAAAPEELAARLEVSPDVARRALAELLARRLVRACHDGAVAVSAP